jgi:ribosomal protein L18E
VTKKLQVVAHKFSKSAEQKITDCGGTATKLSIEVKPIKGKQKQHA